VNLLIAKSRGKGNLEEKTMQKFSKLIEDMYVNIMAAVR
jgi:hypothetical protein